MSNKTRLQTNNTNLQALIDKANALPDAGSSGGGSVETCTVNILSTTESTIIGTVVNNNGELETSIVTATGFNYFHSGTMEDILCGSTFVIIPNSSYSITISSGSATIVQEYDNLIVFTAPLATEECDIELFE